MRLENGSLRLFTVFGISVFVHWSWAVVALLEFQFGAQRYSAPGWMVAEYLTIFGIVLLHEFGHALACRSVGGKAEQIMLWPLGGVAFVSPPPRPGAQLWSIAAGPLVNAVLIAAWWGFDMMRGSLGLYLPPVWRNYVFAFGVINIVLLIFNLLPIYPLDGGQILRSVLWFFIGPLRSLSVACSIGLVGALGGMGLALWIRDWWLVLLALFAMSRSWNGLAVARRMRGFETMPRHTDMRGPACHAAPPLGAFWTCPCGLRFDTFANQAVCPRCQRVFEQTVCPACGQAAPFAAWQLPLAAEVVDAGAHPPTAPENAGPAGPDTQT